MSTALAWEGSSGLPAEIASLFTNAEDAFLRDCQLAIAIPEYKVMLAGGSPESQNDVFCLLSSESGLVSMMVESKVAEDFDVTIGAWKKRTSPAGVKARLDQIQTKIGLTGDIPEHIRYQLLHRTASAVIEAERFHARHAAMVVHSFATNQNNDHFDDYENFLNLYGVAATRNKLTLLLQTGVHRLYTAWVTSPQDVTKR